MPVPTGVWLLLAALVVLIFISFFLRKTTPSSPETIADRDLD